MSYVCLTITTNEVKVGNARRLALGMFVNQKFHRLLMAVATLLGEGKDATPCEEAISATLTANSIPPSLDTALVAITIDGAPILLSAPVDNLRGLAEFLRRQTPLAPCKTHIQPKAKR